MRNLIRIIAFNLLTGNLSGRYNQPAVNGAFAGFEGHCQMVPSKSLTGGFQSPVRVDVTIPRY